MERKLDGSSVEFDTGLVELTVLGAYSVDVVVVVLRSSGLR